MPNKKKKQDNTLIPAVVVMLSLCGAIGVFAFSIWPQDDEFDLDMPLVKKDANQSVYTTDAASGEWKTFKTAEHNFTFSYPPNAYTRDFTQLEPRIDIITGDVTYSLRATTVASPAVSNIASNPECYVETEKKTMNGIEWSINDFQCGIGGSTDVVYVHITGNNVYEFTYDKTLEHGNFKKVLESFTLTK
jgi:hypothetical protein